MQCYFNSGIGYCTTECNSCGNLLSKQKVDSKCYNKHKCTVCGEVHEMLVHDTHGSSMLYFFKRDMPSWYEKYPED